MNDGQCPSCGTSSPPDANYCAVCGTNLDSTFVTLDDGPAGAEQLRTPPRIAALVVPLMAIGFLALLAFVLFANGGDTGGDDETAIEDPPTPSPDPDLTPAPTPEPGPTASATAEPTATPTPVIAVDPAAVPPTAATHLVVAYTSDVSFLELGTGTWTTVDAGRRLGLWPGGPFGGDGALQPFGDGIVVHGQSGGAYQVRVDGTVETVGQGYNAWLMGVANDLAYLQIDDEGGIRVEVTNPSGTVVEVIELPQLTWPQGLTSDGRIVVEAGGRVFTLGGGSAKEIATGQLMGVVADLVLVSECDAGMRCSTEAVHAITGERSPTPLPAGWVEHRPDGLVMIHDNSGPGRLFELNDGVFTEVDEAPSLDPYRPVAIDATGVRANIRGSTVVFLEGGPDPTELGTVAWPAPSRCCPGEVAITFLTIEPEAG